MKTHEKTKLNYIENLYYLVITIRRLGSASLNTRRGQQCVGLYPHVELALHALHPGATLHAAGALAAVRVGLKHQMSIKSNISVDRIAVMVQDLSQYKLMHFWCQMWDVEY